MALSTPHGLRCKTLSRTMLGNGDNRLENSVQNVQSFKAQLDTIVWSFLNGGKNLFKKKLFAGVLPRITRLGKNSLSWFCYGYANLA